MDVRDELLIGHAQLLETKNGERRGVPIAGPALKAVRVSAPTVGPSAVSIGICLSESDWFRVQSHAQRLSYLQDGCKAWITVLAERLI